MVNLSYDEKVNLAKLLAERNRRNAGRAFFTFFPDDGPLSRVHYPKHLRFMDLGAVMKTRCFMAGNRIGKTVTGAYEMTCHLTGRYPHWWTGRRFTASISAWCAGDTSKTVRDIIQLALMGKIGEFGTGMIPREDIMRTTSKQGVSDAIETIYVRHVSGEVSICGLKSYDQGRQAFQGTAQDVIWLDEESDESIRSECILRLMTTQGLLIETFTPLKGITPIVMTYLPGETMQDDGKGAFVSPDRAMVMAGWDDVPHLAEEDKARMKAETPPHLLEARSTGKPAIGSGAIYPIPEAEITVNDFVIPKHWRRAYGFDVGWNCTAALWGAIDPTDGTLYIYSQYKDGKKEPPIHAAAIKTRGKWIPGAIDPASRGGSQKDGEKLLTLYRAEGLELTPADNTVEVALDDIWRAFSTGQIKVFRSLRGFFEEYRLYRRNEKGQVVKVNDHLMDCLHPETKVLTMLGAVPIKELVNTQGKVLTVNGEWASYGGCRKTHEDEAIVRVTFSNGSVVRCTEDHQFLTPDGWVKAIDMLHLSCYDAISQSIQGRNPCKSTSYRKNSSRLTVQSTGCADTISSGTGAAYTLPYGNTIMGRFKRGLRYTISTTTRATTKLKTSLLSNGEPIRHTTRKVTADPSPNFPEAGPLNGMEVKPGGSGTKNTNGTIVQRCTIWVITFAPVAGKVLWRRIWGAIDSVPITARVCGADVPGLMTSKKDVSSVADPISLINTPLLKPVEDHAVISCVSVESAGRSETYCLEVEGYHAFAVEGGAVVHNCMRYLWRTGRTMAVVQPVNLDPGTIEAQQYKTSAMAS